jgi:hypothetical protein
MIPYIFSNPIFHNTLQVLQRYSEEDSYFCEQSFVCMESLFYRWLKYLKLLFRFRKEYGKNLNIKDKSEA